MRYKKTLFEIDIQAIKKNHDSYSDWKDYRVDATTSSPKSTLMSNISNSATSIEIENYTDFPLAIGSDYKILLISDGNNYEYVKVTSVTLYSDHHAVVNCTRGYWGSTARSWGAGTPVYAVNYQIDSPPNYDFDWRPLNFVKATITGSSGNIPPTGLRGFGSVHVGNYIYLFGGVVGNTYYNDIYRLNTISKTWTKLYTTGTPPSPRAWCALGYSGNYLFVFGGYDGSSALTSCYKISLSSLAWQSIASLPEARYHCSAVSYDQAITGLKPSLNTIDIFGGHTFTNKFLRYSVADNSYNSFYVYDTDGNLIYLLQCSTAQQYLTNNALIVAIGWSGEPIVHMWLKDSIRLKACSTPYSRG